LPGPEKERQVLAIQRVEGATIQFIEELPGWNRALPTTLIAPADTLEQRRAKLHEFVARALALHPGHVEIEHAADRPPIVGKPLGSGLYLSSSSRGGFAALGAASAPIGVDVEALDEAGEIPWNVLRPSEAEMLQGLKGRPRSMAFARLWSLKECYLKSLGLGLGREPSTFAVRFLDGELAAVDDPIASARVAYARTAWRSAGGVWSAVSTVVLAGQRR
jgi:phosphopantetheinyl transferase